MVSIRVTMSCLVLPIRRSPTVAAPSRIPIRDPEQYETCILVKLNSR